MVDITLIVFMAEIALKPPVWAVFLIYLIKNSKACFLYKKVI